MRTQPGQIPRTTKHVESMADWSGFVAKIFADDLIDRVTWYRASRNLSSFRDWAYGTFTSHDASIMLRDAIAQHRQPDAACIEVCTAWAALRAQQGVPIDEAAEVFHLYRIELSQRAAKIAPNVTEAPKLVRLSGLAAEWIDTGLLTVLRAYRVSGQAPADASDDRAARLVRSALLGGASSAPPVGEFERYGLNPTRDFYAVRARPAPANSPAEIIEYLCSEGPSLTACINGDVCGMVERLPRTLAAIPVGVAGPVRLSAIGNAYLQASRALETSVAFGLNGLQSVDSLGLYPSVLADTEVGDALVARYIDPFARLGASGRAILATVERYLESGCALAETAKSNYLHVNTVRYRLRKFEETTGRSLKSAEVLSEVWWAFARNRVSHGALPTAEDLSMIDAAAEVVPLRA